MLLPFAIHQLASASAQVLTDLTTAISAASDCNSKFVEWLPLVHDTLLVLLDAFNAEDLQLKTAALALCVAILEQQTSQVGDLSLLIIARWRDFCPLSVSRLAAGILQCFPELWPPSCI